MSERRYASEGFSYDDGRVALRYGRGAVEALDAELDRIGASRAFVVTGETVGRTAGVMEPLRAGLGDRLVGAYTDAGTDLRVGRACEAAREAWGAGADVLVGVGSGSAVSLTRSVRIAHARELSVADAASEVAERGTVRVPDRPTPTVAVPTTLAGAAVSTGAGVAADPAHEPVDERAEGVVADPKLAPRSVVFDPVVFEPTPPDVLAASAMNGFDKGIETLYAANATPITDATARAGLRRFLRGMEALPVADREPERLDDAVLGGLLTRFGTARPDGHTLSVIHAVGHAFLGARDVHLGRTHAAVAPAVLRYLFDQTDGRRATLADVLAPALDGDGLADGIGGSEADDATRVVAAVESVRETLGLPTRIRDLSDPPARSDLRSLAEATVADPFVDNAPFDPTVDGIEKALRDAY